MPNSKPLDNVPTTSLVAVTQAAVGCGIGLLLAGWLRRSTQRNTAFVLLTLGLISAAPLIVDAVARQINRPESERSMRRRLDSIRRVYGVSDEAGVS